MKRTLRNRMIRVPAWIFLVVGIAGLVLRHTVRDRMDLLAPAFYALAPLVVVIVAALALTLWLRARSRLLSAVAGFVTILAVASWLQTDLVRNPVVDRGQADLRIVLWNVARPLQGEEAFVQPLKEAGGDLILVLEAQAYSEDVHAFWRSHFPGYHVRLIGAGITLLSRGPVSDLSMYAMGEASCFVACEAQTSYGPIALLAVDIESTIFRSRRLPIKRVYQMATSPSGPVIVLGDFNTPHTSAHFRPFYESFQHAFANSGSGLISTWWAFVPLLALDHIWLSDEFMPLRTGLRRTVHSDHAMVIADVVVREDTTRRDDKDREP